MTQPDAAPPATRARTRTMLLWSGAAGYLMLALSAPVRPTGWTGQAHLMFGCFIAFLALRQQQRDGVRVGVRDLPFVLGGGLLLLAVVRALSWAIGLLD